MDEFRAAGQKYGGGGVKSLMESMGLGAVANQVVCHLVLSAFECNSSWLCLHMIKILKCGCIEIVIAYDRSFSISLFNQC